MPVTPPLPQISVNNKPSIVSWNRLEPRPIDWQFNRALRVEVRDAAWMLARQWQIGEFRAEDRASPAFAYIEYDVAKLTHYKAGHMLNSQNPQEAYSDSIPLEVQVEREEVPVDLNRRLQMGQYWIRLIMSLLELPKQEYKTLLQELRTAFPIPLPQDSLNGYSLDYGLSQSNPAERQMLSLSAGRAFDGEKFYRRIKDNLSWLADLANTVYPDDTAKADYVIETLGNKVFPQFELWYNRLFSQPTLVNQNNPNGPKIKAWENSSLEYKFKAVSSQVEDGYQRDKFLVGDDYSSGRLDWYGFDIEPTEVTYQLQENYGGNTKIQTYKRTFFPTNLEYPGAPNARWWEFEDSKVNVGKISIDTADLGRMFFLDFMFLYNGDWFSFPVNMETGSICKVKKLVVTDVFGRRHDIKPAGEGSDTNSNELDWGRWSMYAMSERGKPDTSDRSIFLPPTVASAMEGEPIEKVSFLRDEMANLVWGVEQVIPNGLGRGMSGSQAAVALTEYFNGKGQNTPLTTTNSDFIYKLANTVPENWIPFIPTKVPDSDRNIQYQLGAMPRVVEGLQLDPDNRIVDGRTVNDTIVNSRSQLLMELDNPDNPYIYEEEVPREGTTVTRSFQRTRWFNGKTYVWLGRQKKAGRGEGSSGLLFDQLIPVPPAS
ncbi:hypothetical protein [Adhaeribacter soli]|uniref:Uncharacterized protein n=1 Tax=Adhaeribacter soli TaxID=2607655 RepID=A0A5N1J1M0_9BACT|nr:hypothetical protein [Adhaeribacter soli]KAA9338979.1 hypothetical protein F0P94_09315 [Adhaeribacter soli]